MNFQDKIHAALNESTSEFTALADLEVHVDVADVLFDSPAKISVPFDLELDYRGWGLKSIDYRVGGKQTVTMQFFKGEEEFEKDVVLDFAAAKVEETDRLGGGFTVSSVYVVLDTNYQPKELTVQVTR